MHKDGFKIMHTCLWCVQHVCTAWSVLLTLMNVNCIILKAFKLTNVSCLLLCIYVFSICIFTNAHYGTYICIMTTNSMGSSDGSSLQQVF